jgi:hypothetical protein
MYVDVEMAMMTMYYHIAIFKYFNIILMKFLWYSPFKETFLLVQIYLEVIWFNRPRLGL